MLRALMASFTSEGSCTASAGTGKVQSSCSIEFTNTLATSAATKIKIERPPPMLNDNSRLYGTDIREESQKVEEAFWSKEETKLESVFQKGEINEPDCSRAVVMTSLSSAGEGDNYEVQSSPMASFRHEVERRIKTGPNLLDLLKCDERLEELIIPRRVPPPYPTYTMAMRQHHSGPGFFSGSGPPPSMMPGGPVRCFQPHHHQIGRPRAGHPPPHHFPHFIQQPQQQPGPAIHQGMLSQQQIFHMQQQQQMRMFQQSGGQPPTHEIPPMGAYVTHQNLQAMPPQPPPAPLPISSRSPRFRHSSSLSDTFGELDSLQKMAGQSLSQPMCGPDPADGSGNVFASVLENQTVPLPQAGPMPPQSQQQVQQPPTPGAVSPYFPPGASPRRPGNRYPSGDGYCPGTPNPAAVGVHFSPAVSSVGNVVTPSTQHPSAALVGCERKSSIENAIDSVIVSIKAPDSSGNGGVGGPIASSTAAMLTSTSGHPIQSPLSSPHYMQSPSSCHIEGNTSGSVLPCNAGTLSRQHQSNFFPSYTPRGMEYDAVQRSISDSQTPQTTGGPQQPGSMDVFDFETSEQAVPDASGSSVNSRTAPMATSQGYYQHPLALRRSISVAGAVAGFEEMPGAPGIPMGHSISSDVRPSRGKGSRGPRVGRRGRGIDRGAAFNVVNAPPSLPPGAPIKPPRGAAGSGRRQRRIRGANAPARIVTSNLPGNHSSLGGLPQVGREGNFLESPVRPGGPAGLPMNPGFDIQQHQAMTSSQAITPTGLYPGQNTSSTSVHPSHQLDSMKLSTSALVQQTPTTVNATGGTAVTPTTITPLQQQHKLSPSPSAPILETIASLVSGESRGALEIPVTTSQGLTAAVLSSTATTNSGSRSFPATAGQGDQSEISRTQPLLGRNSSGHAPPSVPPNYSITQSSKPMQLGGNFEEPSNNPAVHPHPASRFDQTSNVDRPPKLVSQTTVSRELTSRLGEQQSMIPAELKSSNQPMLKEGPTQSRMFDDSSDNDSDDNENLGGPNSQVQIQIQQALKSLEKTHTSPTSVISSDQTTLVQVGSAAKGIKNQYGGGSAKYTTGTAHSFQGSMSTLPSATSISNRPIVNHQNHSSLPVENIFENMAAVQSATSTVATSLSMHVPPNAQPQVLSGKPLSVEEGVDPNDASLPKGKPSNFQKRQAVNEIIDKISAGKHTTVDFVGTTVPMEAMEANGGIMLTAGCNPSSCATPAAVAAHNMPSVNLGMHQPPITTVPMSKSQDPETVAESGIKTDSLKLVFKRVGNKAAVYSAKQRNHDNVSSATAKLKDLVGGTPKPPKGSKRTGVSSERRQQLVAMLKERIPNPQAAPSILQPQAGEVLEEKKECLESGSGTALPQQQQETSKFEQYRELRELKMQRKRKCDKSGDKLSKSKLPKQAAAAAVASVTMALPVVAGGVDMQSMSAGGFKGSKNASVSLKTKTESQERRSTGGSAFSSKVLQGGPAEKLLSKQQAPSELGFLNAQKVYTGFKIPKLDDSSSKGASATIGTAGSNLMCGTVFDGKTTPGKSNTVTTVNSGLGHNKDLLEISARGASSGSRSQQQCGSVSPNVITLPPGPAFPKVPSNVLAGLNTLPKSFYSAPTIMASHVRSVSPIGSLLPEPQISPPQMQTNGGSGSNRGRRTLLPDPSTSTAQQHQGVPSAPMMTSHRGTLGTPSSSWRPPPNAFNVPSYSDGSVGMPGGIPPTTTMPMYLRGPNPVGQQYRPPATSTAWSTGGGVLSAFAAATAGGVALQQQHSAGFPTTGGAGSDEMTNDSPDDHQLVIADDEGSTNSMDSTNGALRSNRRLLNAASRRQIRSDQGNTGGGGSHQNSPLDDGLMQEALGIG